MINISTYLTLSVNTLHSIRSTFSISCSRIFCWQISNASESISNPITRDASSIAAPIDNAPQPLPKSATSLPLISPYWDWNYFTQTNFKRNDQPKEYFHFNIEHNTN